MTFKMSTDPSSSGRAGSTDRHDSSATPPYPTSLSAGPLRGIQNTHRAARCRSSSVDPVWCVVAYRSTSLISSSLLLQQCPACLVRLSLMVYVIGGKCPYSCFFVGCCFQDLFKAARSILVQLPSILFSRRLVNVHVVHPYSSTDVATAWKNSLFSLSVRSDFHIVDSPSFSYACIYIAFCR